MGLTPMGRETLTLGLAVVATLAKPWLAKRTPKALEPPM